MGSEAFPTTLAQAWLSSYHRVWHSLATLTVATFFGFIDDFVVRRCSLAPLKQVLTPLNFEEADVAALPPLVHLNTHQGRLVCSKRDPK